jgi:tryptophanyl-tRNA synthetase
MKDLLYEKLINFLKPIQQKYYALSDEEVTKLLEQNEEKCRTITNQTMQKVYQQI